MREKENTQKKNKKTQVINGMLMWTEICSTCTNKI